MHSDISPLILFLAAPFVGSFLGVLVTRLPRREGVVWGRSRCDHCQETLGLPEMLPLVGYFAVRGHCRACGEPISRLYLFLEIASIAVVAWSVTIVPPSLQLVTCALGWTLLALAATDLREMLLPDELTLTLVAAGLAVAWWIDDTRLWSHLLGAIIGAGFVAVIAIGYRTLRGREGIGWGDAKLLAAGGAWLSWEGLPSVVLIAATTGLLAAFATGRLKSARDLQRPVPFGVFLAAAIWLVWLYGPLRFHGLF